MSGSALFGSRSTNNILLYDAEKSFDLSRGWTIGGWIDRTGSANGWDIFGTFGMNNPSLYFHESTNIVEVCMGDASWFASTFIFPRGGWHHLLATCDPSFYLRIYTDGKLCVGTDVGSRTYGEGYGMGIGCLKNTATAYKNPYVGKIDSVCFYNRSLNRREVRELYEATMAGHVPPFDVPNT